MSNIKIKSISGKGNIIGDNNIVSNQTIKNEAVSTINGSDNKVSNEFKTIDENKLIGCGVLQADIIELKEIIEKKSNVSEKIGKWLASVGASMTARGLYDSFPIVENYIKQWVPFYQ